MPRVPTFDDPRIQRRGLQAARQQSINPSLREGNSRALDVAGRGLSQLAQLQERIQQRRQERKDRTSVYAAEAALRGEYLEWARQAQDERKGLRAEGVTKEFNDHIAQRIESHAQAMPTQEAQDAFVLSAARVVNSGTETLSRFEAQQGRIAHVEAMNGATAGDVRVAIETAQMAGGDLIATIDAVNTSKGSISDRLTDEAASQGWSPEQLENKRLEVFGGIHSQIIANLADDHPDAAKDYYRMFKDEIPAEDRKRLKDGIDAAGSIAKVQGVVDGMVGKFDDLTTGNKWIRENYEGKEERDMLAEWRNRRTEIETAEDEQKTQIYEQSGEYILQTGRMPKQSVLNKMDAGQRANLIKVHRAELNRRRILAKGQAVETDLPTYYKLAQMSDVELSKIDLGMFADKLAKADADRLLARKAKALNAKPTRAPGTATFRQQIKQQVDILKLDTPNAALFAWKADNMHDELVNQQQNPVSYEQEQKILDKLLLSGTTPGIVWNTSTRWFQVKGNKDLVDVFRFDIPRKEREGIIATLRRRKGDPNHVPGEEAIQGSYRLMLQETKGVNFGG